MKKAGKILGIIALVLLGLYLLVQLALLASVPLIERRVNSDDQVPLRLNIGGIYFNPFTLSFHFTDIEARAKTEQQDETRISRIEVPHLLLNFEAWSSLQRRAVALKIRVNEAFIRGEVPLPGEVAEPEAPSLFDFVAQKQQEALSLPHLWIQDIKVEDARAEFYHPKIGTFFEVNDFNLEATEIGEAAQPESQLEFSASTTGQGQLQGSSQFTRSDTPNLNIDFKLEKLQLAAFQDLVEEVAKIDPESGELNVFAEVRTKQQKLNGYLKVIAENVQIYSPEADSDKPIRHQILESLAQSAKSLLENQNTDAVAFEAPIQGDLQSAETDILSIVRSVLRNAFIEAIEPGFANQR